SASLRVRDVGTFPAHPSTPSFSRVVAEQTPHSPAACPQSNFDSRGIHRDVSGCRALLTRESCESPESDEETTGNLRGAGEVRESSLPRNWRRPERPRAGRLGLRRFRTASGRRTTTACLQSAKRVRLPCECRGK